MVLAELPRGQLEGRAGRRHHGAVITKLLLIAAAVFGPLLWGWFVHFALSKLWPPKPVPPQRGRPQPPGDVIGPDYQI